MYVSYRYPFHALFITKVMLIISYVIGYLHFLLSKDEFLCIETTVVLCHPNSPFLTSDKTLGLTGI